MSTPEKVGGTKHRASPPLQKVGGGMSPYPLTDLHPRQSSVKRRNNARELSPYLYKALIYKKLCGPYL